MAFIRKLAAVSLFFALPIISLPTISVIGAKFFDSEGNQFFIKGVVYQLSNNAPYDPLVDTAQCTRDASLLKTLGANTVRVYTVDAKSDHTGCMAAFDAVGIYVLVGLGDPTNSLNRADPKWTDDLYNHFTATIDAFSGFNNTLGFFAGNEIINDSTGSSLAPYIKAIAIDLKAYRDGMNYRTIPIGYGAADVTSLSPMLQDYLACGSNGIDFFGQHDYSWCGASTMAKSGFDKLYANASGYNVPIFIAETGCTENTPRTWGDQIALFGSAMNDRFSGAIVYEWSLHENGYGLISYAGGAASGTPTPISADFSNLKSRWSTLTPTGIPLPSYDIRTVTSTLACPSSTASVWSVNGEVSLPTLAREVINTRISSSSSKTGISALTGLPTLTGKTSSAKSSATSTSSNPLDDTANAQTDSTSSSGLATGAIVGIAVGVVLMIIAAAIAFLLWRRRKKQQPSAPLDLTPEGLEVGSPPPKHELDSNAIMEKFSERQLKAELPDGHSATFSDGTTQNTDSEPSTAIVSGALGAVAGPPAATDETRHSQNFDKSAPAAELATGPATPKPVAASIAQSTTSVTRRSVPGAVASASWANTPWHSPPMDETPNQEAPLLSGTDEEDEMRRLDEAERRLDAKIAESERIRALKEEKAALQAKRAELIMARDKAPKS
ncbi:Glucanosyltransferase-domain-containing protein [Rhexocercosporidium sp. MPI-PUGE-AT-0058]|nr:Glucanosyltransferase-domain-containing protein [Rhexocercosporidium sp. MPI-PUGE-AT-0058]